MKKYTVIIFALFAFALFGYRSLPSEAVGFSITHCDTISGLDQHYVPVVFSSENDSSCHFDPDGSNFCTITKWNPVTQMWSGSSYNSFLGIWLCPFPIYYGQAYILSGINQPFDFITCGEYEVFPSYNLITTDGTDQNLIVHPPSKYNLTMAGSGIGNDVGYCGSVTKWNNETQSYEGTSYNPYLGWLGDFESYIGQPLFLNMTDSVIWPSDEAKSRKDTDKDDIEVPNLPKSLYYSIVKSTNEKFDSDETGNLDFAAWITGREEEILTEENYGCGFEQAGTDYSVLYINLGNFKTQWEEGDVVNFEVTDNSIKDTGTVLTGKGEYVLDNTCRTAFRGFEPLIKGSGDPIILNTPTGEDEIIPYETALYQNYPNPFNPVTTIKFSLKNDCDVKLRVFNYKGQVTNLLVSGKMDRGFHSVQFNADMLSSGVYFYTLEADGKKLIRKMVLVR